MKRKKCLNCKNAEVIRCGKYFPMGVRCKLEPIPDDPDVSWMHLCHHVCEKWDGKKMKEEVRDDET